MIYEVEVSEQADSDLRGIFEYIAFLRVDVYKRQQEDRPARLI